MDFNENTVEGTSKNGISFKTFKSRTGLHEFKKTISLANEFTNIQAKKSIQNHNIFKEFSVDTSYIKQCVAQNQTTYSFKIIPKIITSNSIFNLIVYNKNGVWETTIIEMMPSKQNLKDLISGSSNQFKGKMRLIYQSNPFQKSNNNHSARATTTGTGYTTIFVESSHCTGTGKCASGTCDKCNLCVSYSSYRVPVTGEAVEAFEEYTGGGTQGGGGGGGPIYEDPSGYVIDPNLFDLSDPQSYLILQKAQIAATFWADLLDEQQQWATLNHDKYSALLNYYLENTSPESKAFAMEAINSLEEGSDVDLAYKVIVDKSFKDNPCLNGVYEKLGKAPTFDNYLKEYDSDFSVVDLKLSSGVDAQYPLASAVTYKPINSLIEIKFNPNYLNLPPLNIARTFIHEMIHAEIYRKLLLLSKRGEIPWSSDFIENIKNNEKEIAHYYLMYKYEIPIGGSPSEPQHEYMAALMRETIIKVMKQYDNTQSEKVYEALSWIGLMGEGEPNALTGLTPQPTAAWVATSKENRLQILETYRTFLKNNSKCQ